MTKNDPLFDQYSTIHGTIFTKISVRNSTPGTSILIPCTAISVSNCVCSWRKTTGHHRHHSRRLLSNEKRVILNTLIKPVITLLRISQSASSNNAINRTRVFLMYLGIYDEADLVSEAIAGLKRQIGLASHHIY